MAIRAILDSRLKSGTAQGQLAFWDNTLKQWVPLDRGLTQDADLQIWVRGYLTGTSPIDLGVAGNTWVQNGGATNTDAGVIGPALTFDGTGDWFDVATSAGLPTGTSARTIYMWIRKNVTDTLIAFSYGGLANGASLNLAARNTGQFAVTVTGGNVFSTSTVLNDLKWHSIAVTFDPADTGFSGSGDIRNAKLYVDGIFTANITSVEEIIDTQDTKLYIGVGYAENIPFNGEIDDIRVYSRVLDADEILELHQLGTLDAMTAFTAAYFKEYVASRHAYFNRLHVSGGMNDVTMTGLTVTGGRDIDINASDLIGTGTVLPEDDLGQNLGSATKTWSELFVNDIKLEDGSIVGIDGPGNPIITFDASNGFFEFIGGDVGIRTTTPDATLQVVGDAKFGDDNTNYTTVGPTGNIGQAGSATARFNATRATTLTITGPTQDWKFSATQTTGALGLQSLTPGVQPRLQLFSKDGDETDNVFIDIFGRGTPDDISTFHRLVVGYSQSVDRYLISSQSKDMTLHAGAGDVQIKLNTDASIDIGGDMVFVGGGGLAFAEINVVSNAVETVIDSAGLVEQVTIFTTNAPSNNATPDHTNDHITITKAGIYFITVSATINSVTGAASRLELTVLKNNGTALVGALHCDRNLGGGGSESGSVSISGLGTLSVNDTIEVWIENETNTQNYIVEDITLTLIQIGGT